MLAVSNAAVPHNNYLVHSHAAYAETIAPNIKIGCLGQNSKCEECCGFYRYQRWIHRGKL
jgi:hypothetical protein